MSKHSLKRYFLGEIPFYPDAVRLLIFTCLLGLSSLSSALDEGQLAPLMVLKSHKGDSLDLRSYAKKTRKRNLLLVFFRTGTCNICITQLQDIGRELDRFSSSNVAVVGISTDDAIVQAETSRKIELRFPILMDADAKLIKAFGVYNHQEKLSRPSVFLVGPDRRVLFRYVGQAISDRLPSEKLVEVVRHYSGLLPTSMGGGK